MFLALFRSFVRRLKCFDGRALRRENKRLTDENEQSQAIRMVGNPKRRNSRAARQKATNLKMHHDPKSNEPVITESEASVFFSDPAENDGRIVELKNASGDRYLMRIVEKQDERAWTLNVLGRIVPDPVLAEVLN